MGNLLDSRIVQELVDSPVTVNTDYEFASIDIMNRENEFSFQIDYNNGSSVDMIITLEVSNDNVSFSTITDSDQAITDPSGTHIYDISGSGVNYIRVKIAVTSGSIDVTKINYMAKRRH